MNNSNRLQLKIAPGTPPVIIAAIKMNQKCKHDRIAFLYYLQNSYENLWVPASDYNNNKKLTFELHVIAKFQLC